MRDNVNHPKHYESSCSLECIEVMELCFGRIAVFNFCVCNCFKYLWRFKNKNGKEDLDKADWYFKYASKIERLDNEQLLVLLKLSNLLKRINDKLRGE